MMKKKYLLSEDEFCGQVVIICETSEVEVKVDTRSSEQAYADMVMGRDDSYAFRTEKRTAYRVQVFYHYEDDEKRGELYNQVAWTKEDGNELFKQAREFFK